MPVRRGLPQLFFRHAQKYLIADVDTYRKGPEDDIYPGHPINYVKLDRLPILAQRAGGQDDSSRQVED
jgi:hypothetical protein